MKKILVLLFCVAIISQNIQAQSIGAGFTLGFPRGEFNNEVKRTAIGGQLNVLLFESRVSPFSAGINVGFYNYGSESRNEPWSTTIPDVYLNVDRSSDIIHFDVLFRLQPQNMVLRPYADLLFGGAYAFTTTKVTSESEPDKEIASSTNINDFIWSYGAGVGLQYKLTDNGGANNPAIGGIYLDLNVRYMATSPAEYIKEGGIEKVPDKAQIITHVSRSRMDLLTVTLGVQLQMDWSEALKNAE